MATQPPAPDQAALVTRALTLLDLKPKELAERIDCSAPHLRNVRAGRCRLSRHILKNLLAVLVDAEREVGA